MFKSLAILLMIVISRCSARCALNKDLSMQCESIEDVTKIGLQNVRQNLIIKSNGAKQRIQSSTFGRHSKLTTLSFINSVNNIESNSFSGLLALKSIKFENCDLVSVSNRWFNRLASLETVEILKSGVTSLEARSFEGSYSLKHLTIRDNDIPRLVANSFSDTSLIKLVLDRNHIAVIEESAFANMPYLKVLSLHGNSLTSFDSKEIFGVKVSGLQALLLSNNKLESFTQRPFASLEVLHLQNNRLNFFPADFLQHFPKLIEMNVFENPWQCGCYFRIVNGLYGNNVNVKCSEEYSNGQRPVCVMPETSSDKCTEEQNSDHLYAIYKAGLKSYPDVKCNEQANIYYFF